MIGRQIEEKECAEPGRLRSRQGERAICPVCGKEIHEVNLPDVKSVVEDRLAWVGFVIVDSFVCLLIDCEHRFADRDIALDNLHEFTAVVTCEFDSEGVCTHFEVKEIRAKR